MNKNWFLMICTVCASFVFTVTANAQVVVYSNDFEDGNMLAEIGSETLVEDSAAVSIVPVAVAPDETFGNNVLLLDRIDPDEGIELDLTLNLTDTLSLTDGNTVTIDFDYAARRTNDVARTIFVEPLDSEGNIVMRFVLGERGSLGVGAEAARQRPGFSVLSDMGNAVNMPFGSPPGAFWWGQDGTPDTFDVGRAAHMSLTIGASTFDFSTVSQAGVEFNATDVSNFDGTSTEIAAISICSFGVNYGGYFDNIQVAGVVSEFLLGDVNRDGIVNFLDISPFIGVLTASGVQAEADVNQDGVVNFLDIAPFIGVLTGAAS